MKKINKNISLLRAILCIAVLLYHLKYLKGGYLAVCSFFVLAGYFSCISMYKSKKHSLIKYYYKKIKGIIIPLLIVVFSTIGIMKLLSITIYNFKPEVNSVLLNYNNYHQINSNVDYFAKRIESPFIHLWYISILVQLQLVFPFIFLLFKTIGDKVKIIIPCILMFILAFISTMYFYDISRSKDIMFTYYDTLSRSFSFIFGMFIGFIHIYYDKFTIKSFTKKSISIIFFITYLLSLIGLFIFIDSSNKYFSLFMILTTILTIRVIEYGRIMFKNNCMLNSSIINYISNISYEVYLVQYPVIYIINTMKISNSLKLIYILLSIIIISTIIREAIKFLKKDKLMVIRIILLLPILGITLYGASEYIIMKDYTKEIEDLKQELANNEKLIKERQEEYKKKQQKEDDDWQKYLLSLKPDKKKITKYVSNLKMVAIGDSIMVDSASHIYKVFPNAYIDAKISRSTCAAVDVFRSIKAKGIKWDIVVFNLGTNGYPTPSCNDKLLNIAGDVKIFWLNTTRPDYDINNRELNKYAKKHKNVYVLDWESFIKKHPEYLYSDYIHPRPEGMTPYAEFIRDEIVKVYINEYDKEREKLIKKHNEEVNNNITFYGNKLLLNSFNLLQEKYPTAKFEVSEQLDFNKLKELITNDIKQNRLNKKLVFIFDKDNNYTKEEYEEIIKICKNNNIYILNTNNISIEQENVKLINFNITKSDLMDDGIHLKNETNKKMINIIIENIK